MIVRKIRPEELRRTEELFSIAFNAPAPLPEKPQEEILEQYQTRPKNRFEKYCLEKWAAFEDDDKTMTAAIIGTPYEVEFDGSTVKMSGVGGVSSLPHQRRQGAVRGCFQKYLRDIYEDGFLLSTLYPFSASYYRQYGYECSDQVTVYELPIPLIPRFPVEGSVQMAEGGRCAEDAQAVYDAFRKGLNLAAQRNDLDNGWLLQADPARERMHIYVYYSGEGVPKGVMAYEKEVLKDSSFRDNPACLMSCRHFYFSDLEGLKGLLNFCHAFEADFNYVSFQLPRHMRAEYLIQERRSQSRMYLHRAMKGMVRVVNVKRALELARYQGEGSLTIQVRDAMLPENDKTFLVEFAEGKAVSVSESRVEIPDADLNITDFSRFLIGALAPEEMYYVDTARFNAPMEKISKVFYKKPVFLSEGF